MKSNIIASLAGLALLVTSVWADESHTSTQFKGPKANTGTVMHTVHDGKNILTLSDDFKVPETPDPHWQVVDSQANTYPLQKLKVKGTLKDKVNTTITVPAYVPDISKVQVWCAYAEVVLGEASFEHPVQITSR